MASFVAQRSDGNEARRFPRPILTEEYPDGGGKCEACVDRRKRK
ncbi:MAG TPA: hypothetical protein VED87_07135 [Methylocystis sp.]|nr:hypothetical protein [Methylocystis sp.]